MSSIENDHHRDETLRYLQTWSEFHVRPEGYPLTLEAARAHAAAFMLSANADGISRSQIESAIHGRDLTDVMVLKMRQSIDTPSVL